MIELYQFPRAWSLPSASPYCVKASVYMQLAGVPFKTISLMSANKAPNKKLPYIKDNETIIADSSCIIEYLVKTYQADLNSHLDERQRAQSLAIQSLIEDRLYYYLIYARWIDDDSNHVMRKVFKRALPPIVHQLVFYLAQKNAKKQVWYQGIGRHSKEQIYAFAKKTIAALSQLLGNNQYFLGGEVSTVDAIAYAFLGSLLKSPVDHPIKKAISEDNTLVAYCDRIATLIEKRVNNGE